jgi:S-adenosylhomocysteine hydrolase
MYRPPIPIRIIAGMAINIMASAKMRIRLIATTIHNKTQTLINTYTVSHINRDICKSSCNIFNTNNISVKTLYLSILRE